MNYLRQQVVIFFTIFLSLEVIFLYERIWPAVGVFGFCIIMGVMLVASPDVDLKDTDYTDENGNPVAPEITNEQPYLQYDGDTLNFFREDITSMLSKHLPYFTSLAFAEQQKFIQRVNSFINNKVFRIHDRSGFREMPVLISACAVQLSFGLEKYILPHFKVINIYPAAFILTSPTIRFLEGNVGDNSINISWKYFLEGFQLPDDGQNVGLHEMAHAYYYQNFGPCAEIDKTFVEHFNNFTTCGENVFNQICKQGDGLFSDYAKRNFQEFWAESVEHFFENSMTLKLRYPEMYLDIAQLLNQDPAAKSASAAD